MSTTIASPVPGRGDQPPPTVLAACVRVHPRASVVSYPCPEPVVDGRIGDSRPPRPRGRQVPGDVGGVVEGERPADLQPVGRGCGLRTGTRSQQARRHARRESPSDVIRAPERRGSAPPPSAPTADTPPKYGSSRPASTDLLAGRHQGGDDRGGETGLEPDQIGQRGEPGLPIADCGSSPLRIRSTLCTSAGRIRLPPAAPAPTTGRDRSRRSAATSSIPSASGPGRRGPARPHPSSS